MTDQTNAAHDFGTSSGGRAYIAEYFATQLRRHDFTQYITTTLAADFACALAQHLSKLRAEGVQAGDERDIERERQYTENATFRVWWDEKQACPEHSLITENAAHAAWQERGRRAALASAPVPPAEATAALDWLDDFVARCNGDDRGACESVNLLRRALASAPVAGERDAARYRVLRSHIAPLRLAESMGIPRKQVKRSDDPAARVDEMCDAALASAPVAAQEFKAAFPNGTLPATRFHERWERAGKTRRADYTMLENLTWQVGQFADLVAREVSAPVAKPSPASEDFAQEVWAAAQSPHGEPMEKSVARVASLLAEFSAPVAGLPERDTAKPAEAQGLFRKFDVHRTDGSDAPGGKHHGCRYFVLDVDHDRYAPAALGAYATACAASHPDLARDLREKWGAAPAAGDARDAQDAGRYRLAVADCILVLRGDAALGRAEWDEKLDRLAAVSAARQGDAP